MAEEATINPDGSQEMPPTPAPEEIPMDIPVEEVFEEVVKKGIDPAIYLLLLFLAVVGIVVYFNMTSKKKGNDDFFDDLDGDKFNLKLPMAADEYYKVKDKCMDAGWEPGVPPPADKQQQGPHRVLAQALMKRCIADIPMVTFIQKESPGMNKLYSQSMCSVKQWRSYQAAEALVSGEVEEVRAEADEIEPGWSDVIWSQAMQYHKMLKSKHEAEAKEAAAAAAKKKAIQDKVSAEQKKVQDAENAVKMAEQAAADLIKMEAREKNSKKAFSAKDSDGLKKGFLNASKKK